LRFKKPTAIIAAVLNLILWSPPLSVGDIGALETLRAKVAIGVALLDDPALKAPDRQIEKEARLWQLSQQLFDYRTMSRLVLASQWKMFTTRQQEAFVAAFEGFLRRFYLPQLLERYNGEKLYFDGERKLSASRAEVDVHVIYQNVKIPFSVRMIRRDGDWRVYDVAAMGVSAVKNYRAQFRWLLLNDTPDQLIARLNARALPAS
jgi:phospholipid transport system substrate-binding protein